MKKYVLLILFGFLLASCTSGKTEFFPSQGFSVDASEVTVIRKRRMWGMGFSMQVLLDGDVIARLKAGQYITFFVDPGVHTIGVSESTITAMLEGGRRHFFAI